MPIILEGTVVMRLSNRRLKELTDSVSLRRLKTPYLLSEKADTVFFGQVNKNIGADIAWVCYVYSPERLMKCGFCLSKTSCCVRTSHIKNVSA